MYKDRSTVVSDVAEIDQKKFEFVNLNELKIGRASCRERVCAIV